MELPHEDSYNENYDINEDNLLLKIWTKPTGTLQFILQNCPTKYVTIFFVLGGMSRAIDRAITKEMGHDMSTINVLLLAIVIGGLTGWVIYYIYAWLMSVTGRWMNGKASPAEFRTILAWSIVPMITASLLYIPQIILYGDTLFTGGITEEHHTSLQQIDMGFIMVELILSIWSLVIYTKGTALVQGFSIGKAIGNILLCILLIVGVIVGLGILIAVFLG